MVLYRVDRTSLLASAALDALVYVGTCGLPVDDLVNARRADGNALTDAGALVIVHFDDDPELLALPFAHVDHERHLETAS